MADYGCTVSAFDPSMGKQDHNHSAGVMFYNLGLSDVNQEGAKNPLSADPLDKSTWKTRTLAAIIQELGHAQVMHKWSDSQSVRQSIRQSDSQADNKAGGQSVSRLVRQLGRQAGRQSGSLVVWQSGSQSGS